MLEGWAVTPTQYFISFLHHRFAYMLPVLALINCNILNRLTSFKIWLFPSLTVMAVSMWQWLFVSHRANIFGFKWFWYALFEWIILFTICLFLYQKKTSNWTAFILSYLSVYLGGLLYEWSLKAVRNEWSIFDSWMNYIIGIILFAYLLWKHDFKPNLKLFWTFPSLLIVWILLPTYIGNQSLDYMMRLSVFPLFIVIPKLLKKQVA